MHDLCPSDAVAFLALRLERRERHCRTVSAVISLLTQGHDATLSFLRRTPPSGWPGMSKSNHGGRWVMLAARTTGSDWSCRISHLRTSSTPLGVRHVCKLVLSSACNRDGSRPSMETKGRGTPARAPSHSRNQVPGPDAVVSRDGWSTAASRHGYQYVFRQGR